MRYVKLLFIFGFVLLLPGKLLSQPELESKVNIELKVNGQNKMIESASATPGGGFFTLFGFFGKDERRGTGADLSVSARGVYNTGSYKIYIAEIIIAGKSYFAKEEGELHISKWEHGKVSGNFSCTAKSEDGKERTLEGDFFTDAELVKIKVITVWDCTPASDEYTIIPIPYATFQIDNNVYHTGFFGDISIKIPAGKHNVTVRSQDPTHGELGGLNHALWKNKKIPGATQINRKGYWSAEPFTVDVSDTEEELRLVAQNCPGHFSKLNGKPGFKYIVTKVKGIGQVFHFGSQVDLTEGMIINNGDCIITGDNSSVAIQREPGSTGKTTDEFVVYSKANFQFYFYETDDHKIVRQLVLCGKLWEKVSTDSSEIIYVNDPVPPKKRTTLIIDGNGWGEEEGTIYTWAYDSATKKTIVSVEEGIIHLTPRNTDLKPVTIKAGEKIELTPDNISSIMKAEPTDTDFTEATPEKTESGNTKKSSRYIYIIAAIVLVAIIAVFFAASRKKRKANS